MEKKNEIYGYFTGGFTPTIKWLPPGVTFEDLLAGKYSKPISEDNAMKIKKGDHLMLNLNGLKIPVVAASDSHEGAVQIKGNGTFSTVNLADVELVSMDKLPKADVSFEEISTDPNDLRKENPMAKDKDEMRGLLMFLESVGVSDKDAEEALKKARIDPKDHGMMKAKDLVDYWRKSVEDLTKRGDKK